MDTPSPTPPGKVSFDEALSMAVYFHQQGRFSDAAELYNQLYDVDPNHPDLLHFAGMLAHQVGKSEQGIELIARSLELAPDRAECLNNLGIIYKALGRLDDAVSAYARALALDPSHANAHNNLGVLLKAQHRTAEAEAAYRQAIALDASHIDAHHNLGVLLGSTGRTREAVLCYCKVTTLSPRHGEARRLLALAYCTLGETPKAVAIYEEWLAEDPTNPIPRHLLAACSQQGVPDRADDAFVELTFDGFAASFDAKLANLSYRAPQIVAALLEDSGLPADKSREVLDAGCGTGLCGPLVAPYARRLTGVDLSGKMLDQARLKEVYDHLEKAELTAYLQAHARAFDLIVCADTLCYFGALQEVLQAAAHALTPVGMFLFTVEAVSDAAPPAGFVLATHGRYAHTRDYVRRMLSAAGLTGHMVDVELRMESGLPVVGLAVRAVAGSSEPAALYSAEASDASLAPPTRSVGAHHG